MWYIIKWIGKILGFMVACPCIYFYLCLEFLFHLIFFFKCKGLKFFRFEHVRYMGYIGEIDKKSLMGEAKYRREWWNNYFHYYFEYTPSGYQDYTKQSYFGYTGKD
jgi:hypothetical protein